jgi:hypothetical protein
VHINGIPGGQLLLAITVFSSAFHTFASRYPPSCQGINSPQLFTATFGAHHFPSSKTTLTIPLRRMSEHLYLDEGPPQESTHNPSFHQSSTQNLHTIAKDPEHPTVEDIPEVQLLQLAHISTTVAGPSQTVALPAQPKPAEGLHVNHRRGHLCQYTWLKETQSSIRSKYMIGMKKSRKMN